MRKYWALTKILLKTGFGSSGLDGGRSAKTTQKAGKSRKINSQVLLYLFLLVCFLPIILMLYGFGYTMYAALLSFGEAFLGVQIISYAGSFLVLVFSLPYVLSAFFLSTDLENLLPLPLKPWQIVGAKFTAVAIYEYLFVGMLLTPMLAGYGVAAAAGPLYWVCALLTLLSLPLTPLVYTSIIGILLMRLLKNMKHKEALVTVGNVLLIVVIVFGSNLINTSQLQSTQMINTLLASQPLLGKFDLLFPNLFLAQLALYRSSLLHMVLYLVSAGLFVALFLYLANKLYFGGVMGMGENGSKRHLFTPKELAGFSHQKSPLRAYVAKEYKSLLRTPTYLMNCVIMPFLFPLLLALPLMVSAAKLGSNSLEGLQMATSFATPNQIMAAGLAGVYGLSLLLGGANYTINTSISREGQGYVFLKYIPMSYRDQLRAKVWCGYGISLLATVPYTLLGCGILLGMGANWLLLPLGVVINLLTVLWLSYLQLWSDLRNPKLLWQSEQAAVKENFSAFLSMLLVYAVGLLLGILAFLGYFILHLPTLLLSILFCLVSAAFAFFLQHWIYDYGSRKLDELA